jgi:hypothetical protein
VGLGDGEQGEVQGSVLWVSVLIQQGPCQGVVLLLPYIPMSET